MKGIAILGTGPAGLMAAHAAALDGWPLMLFGQDDGEGNVKKSRLGGAQFLHQPLPMLHDDQAPDGILTYHTLGDTRTYQKKVYGSTVVPFVSMENVRDGQEVPAWSLQNTYETLWDYTSADKANIVDVTPAWLDEAMEKQWFDHIISTVPTPCLCRTMHTEDFVAPHQFVTQSVYIANEAMIEDEDTICFNGDGGYSWYRSANIFGHGSTEWGASVDPPLQTVTVHKPLRTNCDCFADTVQRMGRFGTWTKGVLTHDSFNNTRNYLRGQ